MNYITLKFRDQLLENQYQELKTNKIRKPLYYGLFTFCFILNCYKIIYDSIQNSYSIPWINYIFLGFMLLSILLRIKNQNYIKQLLVASNIISGLLQLNFIENDTSKQEYYSFGSSFTQLQTVTYFISDFTDGIMQVIAHLIIKILITSFSTHYINILCTSFAITGSLFILVTIYICDCSSRKSFLQTVGQDIWDAQLPHLINKPFFKIQYSNTIIKILQSNLLNNIPCYIEDHCEGCNGRKFLRECQIINVSLSDYFQQKQLILNKIIYANIKSNRINIRICKYGFEYNDFVIILDKIITKTKNKILPIQIRKNLNQQLLDNSSEHLRFYNWGLLSIILINNREIKNVNLFETIKKLNKSYINYLLPIQLFTKSKQLIFPTYVNILRIFLIQIYHILIELHSKTYRTRVQIKDNEDYIEFHILIIDSKQFHKFYKSNLFVQNVQRLILYKPITFDLRFYFSKQLPFL